jgi:hypothetical protein
MEFALAILMISALTTNGLLALWAATSRRHWFLRTAVYLACLSPLLPVPAYEPFIALTLQGTVIAGTVTLGRLRERRSLDASDANDSQRPWRFSLTTMLQATVLIAFAVAIVVRVPTLNRFAWQSTVAIGLCSGLTFAAIYWAGTGTRRIAAVALALGASLLLGAIAGLTDWFLYSAIIGSWVEDISGIGVGFLFEWVGNRSAEDFVLEWPLILPISAITALVVCWLWEASGVANCSGQQRSRRQAVSMFALIGMCVVLATPAALGLCVLLFPDPIPIARLPQPNGFDDLLAAQKMLGSNLIVDSANFDRNVATEPQLIRAVDESADAVAHLELGLQKNWMRQIDYSNAAAFEEIAPKRSLSRAMDAAGRLAAVQGNYADALRWHLNGVKHGFAIRRGGLMIDDLVGCACAGIGAAGVFEIKEHLDGKQCTETISAIEELLAALEPVAEFEHRDCVWVQQAMGWIGRIEQLLDHEDESLLSYRTARRRELAKCRLLMAELAVTAFRKEQGRLPDDVQELVPDALPAMPLDPFSPTGETLRYKRTGDECILYSVGSNGIDEGGRPPDDRNAPDFWDSGDLRLGVEFKPQLQLPTTANAAGEAEVEAADE